ncbi:MAG: hypothetical protein ACOCRO_02555 [Halanaerobiales bacterium]
MALEVENKYIVEDCSVDKVRDFIKDSEKIVIIQNYLSYNDKEELRIREVIFDRKRNYFLTLKSEINNDNLRNELETKINRATYMALLSKCKKNPLIKERYIQKINNNVEVALDLFLGKDNISFLSIVEVEFSDLNKRIDFTKYSWFGKDITNDLRYRNRNIWRDINLV